jgi:hypothetical protein
MPTRIQRRRTKGWRLPPNAVIVSRPSRFGNPCKVGLMQEMGYEDPHGVAAENFRVWLNGNRFDAPTDDADRRRERILAELPSLRGRDVACTCQPDQTCHGDYLLDRANLPEAEQAAWVASVRARVDQQRATWGAPPLADAEAAPPRRPEPLRSPAESQARRRTEDVNVNDNLKEIL